MVIREMTAADYPSVLALLQRTEGMCVREADSPEATGRFLERNPGMSFLAEDAGRVVGCAMSGHDGRRGYLRHVMVEPACRGRGLARELVDRCLTALRAAGVTKVHLEVLGTNGAGQRFWEHLGWTERSDVRRYSLVLSDHPNA